MHLPSSPPPDPPPPSLLPSLPFSFLSLTLSHTLSVCMCRLFVVTADGKPVDLHLSEAAQAVPGDVRDMAKVRAVEGEWGGGRGRVAA
jgi:hypothetical protein